MKNEQTNQALALIGIALLMVASGDDTLLFDDAIKKKEGLVSQSFLQ